MDRGAIDAIASTTDSNAWFLALPAGKLSRYDGKGIVKVTQADGLAGSQTTTLYTDTDGSLLVGTRKREWPVTLRRPHVGTAPDSRCWKTRPQHTRWRARRAGTCGMARAKAPIGSAGRRHRSRTSAASV